MPALRRAAGLVSRSEAAALEQAADWPDQDVLRAAVTLASRHGSEGVRAKAARLLEWLGLPPALRREHWAEWVGEFLTGAGEPRGPSIFANKKLAETYPLILPACLAEQARVAAVQDEVRAHRMVAASAALLRLAAPILAAVAQDKNRRGLLDYADLIGLTRRLLQDPAMGAAWVLFKLDGGLDHLLLDEVQDTAPEQWLIADLLTADFFAGKGTRPDGALPRSIFAVGDRKQSIFAFQGADPAEFDRWRALYGQRVTGAGLSWQPALMDVSFRSTAPVLNLVDAIFDRDDFTGGTGPLRHTPHRAGEPGRVEFWPLAPRPDAAPSAPWTIPERNQIHASAPQTLVNHLAAWIQDQTSGHQSPSGADGKLRPGDVLVLVRRRGDFDRALVRALKSRGVPVAGLDRMMLTDQPAVQDLLALCHALLLPQDDLVLAEFLVSPLGGLTDDSLMQLAASRTGPLRQALHDRADQRADWRAAEDFFSALLRRADYVQPFDLLSEALGPLGGRARLFARLGPESAEPIDELLAACLRYEAAHPPSLQGFTHWLNLSAAEVKREPEAAGDAVRIMTVHGAKGLEAPLVILPDTTGLPPDERGLDWATDRETGAALPLWQPHRELSCRAVEILRQQGEAARKAEYDRLLYVALTRARDRLLICGWELQRPQEGCWYQQVESGLRALGATPAPFDAWPGQALVIEAAHSAPSPPGPPVAPLALPPLPGWAGRAPDWRPLPLPPEQAIPARLAPSRPQGVEHGPLPPARSPLARAGGQTQAFGRGLVMHTLLQHLPALPAPHRAAAATAYASRAAHGLEDPDALAAQALAVLDHPDLHDLFGPASRAEQPVAGVVGGQVISGQVDRLAVLPGRVLIADYKTGRAPPVTLDGVPQTYLRQMAAYRAVLAQIHPDRAITCLLIWTEGPTLMQLPDDLLARHAPGAAPTDVTRMEAGPPA
jgi:ATP-dependent helicase/nuclease subunit A